MDVDRIGGGPPAMIGETIGRYRVLSRLGAGGMGEVWLASDDELRRRVAIKTLHAGAPDAEARLRLLQEARAAASLVHPGIAAVYDVLDAGGRLHIVMEYVEGETLAALIARGPLPQPELLRLADQLADAVAYAHGRGVVHCDLKPGNVIVTREGVAKVLDFGLARVVDAVTRTRLAEDAGQIRGTPAYMAPEVLQGVPPDARVDVYALGVVMYEMAAQRRPYQAGDFLQLAGAILSADPPSLRALAPEVSPGLEAVVVRAMARDRAARFPSAASLRDAIRRLGQTGPGPSGEPVGDVPASSGVARTGRWRRVALRTLVPVGLLLAVALLLAWLRAGGLPAGVEARQHTAVAVLPAPLAGSPDALALSVGFADVLAGKLSAVPGLVLAAPADGTAGAGRTPDRADAIARAAGASHVVVPSITKVGNAIQASVSVREVGSGRIAWSQVVQGEASDVFRLQDRLGLALVGTLRTLKLVPGDAPRRAERRATGPPTSDLDAYAEFSQGRLFEERPDVPGNLERAVDLFGRAIARDPAFALAHAALGRSCWALYSATKDRAWADRARDATTEALRIAPDSPAVRYSLAVIYNGTGKAETAREELERVIAQDPESDDAHRLLGTILAEEGDVAAALEQFETARRLRPGFWLTYRSLGLTFFHAGRYQEAIAAFTRLTELQPDSAWGYQMLGTAHHAAGDRAHALESYRKAIERAPSARSYSNIGTLLYEEARYEEAVASYEQAIRLRPNEALTHRNLADALWRLGRLARAREEYRRAAALSAEDLAVNPRNADAVALQAFCRARLGESARALALSTRAVQLSPEDNTAHFERAVILLMAGRRCEAVEAARVALAKGYSTELARADADLAPIRAELGLDPGAPAPGAIKCPAAPAARVDVGKGR